MEKLKHLALAAIRWAFRNKFSILSFIYIFVVTWKFYNFHYNRLTFALAALSVVLFMHVYSRWKLHIVITVLLTVMVSLNTYFAFWLNTNVTSGLFGAIMDTDAKEAVSMSSSMMLEGILIFVLSFALFFLTIREMRKNGGTIKFSLLGLGFYFLIFIPYQTYAYFQRDMGIWRTEVSEYPLVVAESIGFQTAPVVWGNLITFANYVHDSYSYKNMLNSEDKILPDGVELLTDVENLPNKIVLVIGESASRTNFSLYGYPIPTTPFYDYLAESDSNFHYYNGYASATITRDAIRQTLSFSKPHNMDAFLESKSLIDLANDANYHTTWIAAPWQIRKEGSALYIGLLALSSQEVLYSEGYDDFYLSRKAKEAKREGEKQFILINLNGSHMSYEDKYDEVDEKALPLRTDIPEQELHYNRSIHHTDRVLKEIYENLVEGDSSAVMMYYSDHGDIIGVGHGLKHGREQVQIPLTVINNSSFDLEKSTSKYLYDVEGKESLNSLSTFYILAEMMGYKLSDEHVKYALKESEYVYYSDKSVGLYKDLKDK